MSIELKPCPFCGGEANTFQTRWTNNRWYTCCPSCETICGLPDGDEFVGKYDTEAEAAEAWNTRAERTCKAANLAEYAWDDFECSECGWVTWGFFMEHEGCGTVCKPRFCPNCGAKVVEE